MRQRLLLRFLDWLPAALFAAVLIFFGVATRGAFFQTDHLTGLMAQSASMIIVAVGMTFVLIVAGVDLSVGAAMFVGAALAGKMAVAGQPTALCLAVMAGVGLAFGACNALLITRLRLAAFIATLALLYIGRGAGRWITETRAINLPDSFVALNAAQWLGVPAPIWIAAAVVAAAQGTLSWTPFGRRLYALGHDAEAARKAGLKIGRLQATVYALCGVCAGVGGALALAQLGSVSPKFGEGYEFEAITAAVMGGTSLFGGRGRVFPGTVLGALLVKCIFSGLVMLQVNEYLYPLITSAIIFLAVLLDSARRRLAERLSRRLVYHST